MLTATINLVEIPAKTGLVLLQFDDLIEAMEATSVILETDPSAIELMDRMLISLTRQQPLYCEPDLVHPRRPGRHPGRGVLRHERAPSCRRSATT